MRGKIAANTMNTIVFAANTIVFIVFAANTISNEHSVFNSNKQVIFLTRLGAMPPLVILRPVKKITQLCGGGIAPRPG